MTIFNNWAMLWSNLILKNKIYLKLKILYFMFRFLFSEGDKFRSIEYINTFGIAVIIGIEHIGGRKFE